MKKVLVWSVLVLVVLVLIFGLFWKQILATTIMLQAKRVVPPEQHVVTVTALTPQASSTITNTEHMQLGSLRVPVPFTVASSTSGERYRRSFTQDGVALVLLDEIELRDEFLNDRDPAEKAFICDFLSTRYGEDMCATNYSFFTAMVESDLRNTRLWASRAEKLSQSILSVLRYTFSDSQTVERFQTDSIRGYRYQSTDGNTYIAIFTPSDTQYAVISTLDQATLSHVIAGITTTTTE